MKIVVIGAGGFIGGWLCEELSSRTDVELVPCVRHWSSAVRLARRGLNVVQVDLEDVNEDLAVIAGADVVVNTATPLPDREAELAVRLYSACAATKVHKLIQFSSIAVYGNQTGHIEEDTPPSPSNQYGRGKAEMERRLLRCSAGSGSQVFILRPSIVYGPFSETWTVRYARRIAAGRWRSMGWAGAGTCNLVHGQDVANSVICIATARVDSKTNVLNINGPEVITWNEYFDRFGNALGVVDRRRISPLRLSLTSTAVDGVRKAGSWIKRRGLDRSLQKVSTAKEAAQAVVNLYPMPGERDLWRQKVHYSWDRAVRLIGFRPSIPLDEGLLQSAEWCHIHGVI